MKQDIAKQKTLKSENQAEQWWKEELDKLKSAPLLDQSNTLDRLTRNPKVQDTPWLKIEVAVFRLHIVVCTWLADPKAADEETGESYRVQLLQGIKEVSSMPALTSKIRDVLTSLLRAIGLDEIELPSPDESFEPNRKLSFSFEKTWSDSKARPRHAFFPIRESPVRFQLRLFGPYMDRSMNSRPDPRTSFDPDGWQIEVLDCIDQRTSTLVVAPTSAG